MWSPTKTSMCTAYQGRMRRHNLPLAFHFVWGPPLPGPQTNWKASGRWGPQKKTIETDKCSVNNLITAQNCQFLAISRKPFCFGRRPGLFWHFEKSRDGVVTGRRNAFLGTEEAAIVHYKSALRNNESALNKTPIIGRRLTFGRCFRTSTDERAVIE